MIIKHSNKKRRTIKRTKIALFVYKRGQNGIKKTM